MKNNAINIRKATSTDHDAIWSIIKQVVASGDSYAFAPNSNRIDLLNYWCGQNKHTFVATINQEILGTFVIQDNFPGLGSHIANAGYMTAPHASGRGIGTMMGQQSLVIAKELGYYAIQFNLVIKSNERAVRLWKKLGFEIIGEIPDAFQHQTLGLTNAYIMWQKL